MPNSGNVGFQMPEMTAPPGADVKVQTYADEAKQNSQQAPMPPVYYGGKTGATAFMADKVLTGWLAGTKMGQERKAKKMAEEVGSAKTGLDLIGQAYRSAVEGGDPKKIEQTKAALTEAYNDYLNKAEHYAMPEDGGKKKGVGGKIKEGLKRFAQGGENPHLNIAHSTLEIMRKTDPTQLYGPSKQEQQQSEALDMQTAEMKREHESRDRWSKLNETDPAKWTEGDKKFHEYFEYEKFGKSPDQQRMDKTKDQILEKVVNGQKLSDQEHQLAETFGFVKPNVMSTQIRTITDKKGNPVSQLISIGPDGKLVGTQNLPGNDYVGPNQAQLAGQVINAQMSALMKWGEKAHPEWDQKTPEGKKMLTQWALTAVAGGPSGQTADWYTKNNQMDVMNRAINAVKQKHTSKRKDPSDPTKETQVPDDLMNAVMGNIVSTTDDGRYAYMPSLAPGQTSEGSTWYKPWSWGNTPTESWAGMTRDQLFTQERQFQAELRAELKKQNPKLPDAEIDKMMPPMLSRQQKQGGTETAMASPPSGSMQPPPGSGEGLRHDLAQGALGVFPAPPTKQGEKWYRIHLQDGTQIRSLSPEYVEALQARGVQVDAVQ